MALTTKHYRPDGPLSKYKTAIKIIILIAVPVILILLPKSFFNQGSYTICLFKLLTQEECTACGLTRACMHFIHLDFEEAAKFNKLVFIIMPILSGGWLYELYHTIKKHNAHKKKNQTKPFE